MLEPWTPAIAAHAVAATLALVLGPFQLIRTPKGDPVHKAVGRVWVVLMLVVAASSFLFGGWDEPIEIFLRVLAAVVLVTTTIGLVAARRGLIATHRRCMTGGYVGLVSALIGVVVVPTRLIPSWFVARPVLMSLVTAGLIGAAAIFLAAAVTRLGRRAVTTSR